MAAQVFSPEEREAIWLIHDRVCFYGRRPLKFEAMEIDHIVPESFLALDPKKLSSELKKLGLPDTFDIQGYGNLVPSCSQCNGRKRANLFEVGQIAIFLAQIKGKADKVKELCEKEINGRSLARALRFLSNNLDKGLFTGDDIVEGLKKNGYIKYTNIDSPNKITPNVAINLSGKNVSVDQLVITDVAAKWLASERFTSSDLLYMVSDSKKARRLIFEGQRLYEVNAHSGVRLIFTVDSEKVVILDASRRAQSPFK